MFLNFHIWNPVHVVVEKNLRIDKLFDIYDYKLWLTWKTYLFLLRVILQCCGLGDSKESKLGQFYKVGCFYTNPLVDVLITDECRKISFHDFVFKNIKNCSAFQLFCVDWKRCIASLFMYSKTLSAWNHLCELLLPMVPPTHRPSQHGLGWSPIQSGKWELEKSPGKTSDSKMWVFSCSQS